MTSILVAADPADNAFWEPVSSGLRLCYDTLEIRGGYLYVPPRAAQMALCDAAGFKRIQGGNSIVLFRSAKHISPELFLTEKCVAVVDSCDQKLMSFVSGTGIPAITCGLSSRDTITLSSMGEDSAVIDLQRSVTCFDGTVAEPQEIPVKLAYKLSSYSLMALACIFILCGDITKLAQLKL